MNKKDHITIGFLILLAAFIWLRNTSWMSTFDDTLPILIAIPMFFWIQWPMAFKQESPQMSIGHVIVAALFLVIGSVTDITFLLGMGWTFLFWGWLIKRLDPKHLSESRKLLILPIMAFPWIALDAEPIGWWFRLSGAWVAANFFDLLGVHVIHEGTQLHLNNMPISVEPACSGLNTLQSMLIAGSMVAFLLIGDRPRYWYNLPVIVVIAWLANTIRIVSISAVAITINRDFAMGPFHDYGGWAILFLMFLLCWFVFSLQQPKTETQPPPEAS